MENNMLDFFREYNFYFNRFIEFDEVKNVIMKFKNGKFFGVDEILYEVFKYDCVIEVIYCFFMLCFEFYIIFFVWR